MFSIQKPSWPHFGQVTMKWSLQTFQRCLVQLGFIWRSFAQKRHAEPFVESTAWAFPLAVVCPNFGFIRIKLGFLVFAPPWLTRDVRLSRSHREISEVRGILARVSRRGAEHTLSPACIQLAWCRSTHSSGSARGSSHAEPAGHTQRGQSLVSRCSCQVSRRG